MATTLLFLLVLVVVLAAPGRGTVPRLVRAVRVLRDVHQRQCRLWERYLDDLQPWHHPRRDDPSRDRD
jgi:hypothetical protein